MTTLLRGNSGIEAIRDTTPPSAAASANLKRRQPNGGCSSLWPGCISTDLFGDALAEGSR
jgi:hypothetical protein